MSPGRYGDMQAFVQKLRDMGYERVELIDTTGGSFMTSKEAGRLMLSRLNIAGGKKVKRQRHQRKLTVPLLKLYMQGLSERRPKR